MALTKEQKSIALNLVKGRNNNQYQTLGGYAGTGKTTLINVISEYLDNYAVCAYTGKATNVLRKKGVKNSSTIHSLIYQPYSYEENGEKITSWERVHREHLITDLNIGGFIVDEGSMVSEEIHNDLLSYGLPVIYVGDHGQLEPINSKFNVMKDPMYRLEKVHRNAGEIAHFSNHLREGKDPSAFNCGKQVQIVDASSIKDHHLGNTDQVICAFNKTRVEINERVRKQKNINFSYIAVGEKIMCLRNKRKLGLFNGMQGIVTKIHPNDRFSFESDGKLYEKIHYDIDQFGKESNDFSFSQQANPFDYAYAITAHKAQGDEWGNVIVFEQQCNKWDHKRWSYTAASRAKRGLIWVRRKKFIPKWL